MTLENAIKQLNDFCRAVENEDIRNYIIQKYGDFGASTEKDYEATKVILSELERLQQENEQLIVALKKCSPLRNEIEDLKKILNNTIEFYENEIDTLTSKNKPTRYRIRKRAI